MISINTSFSSGSIQVLSIKDEQVKLALIADNQSDFKQWFHFKVNNAFAKELSFSIEKIDESAYKDGWDDYRVCMSYDGIDWFRIDTEVADNSLKFSTFMESECAYFAYFAPYSYERHQQLVHTSCLHPEVEHSVIGNTIDGRELNLLTIGNSSSDNKIWMIARQHPGETMAEWFIEGLLAELLDEHNAHGRWLLENTCIYCVPNMNPDGSERGHLRTNAVGVNLNRVWNNPSAETSPEVFYVREKMKETGMCLFVDVHGDEGLPYNFFAFSEGRPSHNEQFAALEKAFSEDFKASTIEFQDEFGYSKDAPGQADMSIASNWVGEEFNCLSAVLEMPFKDNANNPCISRGWSPERSMRLGEALLFPMIKHIKRISK